MFWFASVLLMTLPQAAEVAVKPLTGPERTGALVELNGERVVVEVDGQSQTYPYQDLMAIVVRTDDRSNPAQQGVWIELIDGSRLVGKGYRVKNRVAEIQLNDRVVSVETRNIRAVRFHPPAAALDTQWQDILAQEKRGDVIVLRRSDTALDQLEGVFHDVSDDTVQFEFEEEVIDVNRGKLEGMVYHHAVGRELPEPVCAVQEVGGTTWRAKSVELREGQLAVTTPGGKMAVVPWNSVARLDFSMANVAYLGDLEFELADCSPYVASQVSPERLLQLYAPRRDGSFMGEGLYVAGPEGVQHYEKGLAIHSRSELVFRLSEPYRKLTALAGIDSRVSERGHIVLVIAGDGRELLRCEIAGGSEPVEVDLDITGVRRLRILVDYGQSLDIADHLNLCNARIIK